VRRDLMALLSGSPVAGEEESGADGANGRHVKAVDTPVRASTPAAKKTPAKKR
jgi:hypothetical protein